MKKIFFNLALTAIVATAGTATALADAQNDALRKGRIHWPSHGPAAKSAPTAKPSSITSFAVDKAQVEESIELKDGSTVYIFKDGKMGMEDKFGRPTYMESGHVMETKDDKQITMNGNEIWRVNGLLHKDHGGGG